MYESISLKDNVITNTNVWLYNIIELGISFANRKIYNY